MRRRRRHLVRPPQLADDKMFWPGHVAPGYDPVVPAEKVREVCKQRMDGFDRLTREERERINDKGITR